MVLDEEVVKVKEQSLFSEISSLTFGIKDLASALTVCWTYQKRIIVVQVMSSHPSQYIENKMKEGTEQSEIYAMRPHKEQYKQGSCYSKIIFKYNQGFYFISTEIIGGHRRWVQWRRHGHGVVWLIITSVLVPTLGPRSPHYCHQMRRYVWIL